MQDGDPFSALTSREQAFLKKGGFSSGAEVLACPLPALIQRTKLASQEIERCVQKVAAQCMPEARTVSELWASEGDQVLQLDDLELDGLLGGGLQPQTISELVGEAAAGKSHLALQFCLRVQLPEDLGGLSGSAAFLSSESAFPSSRLLQMARAIFPLDIPPATALDHVHLASCVSLEDLEHTVSYLVPALAESLAGTAKPLRLLVIDSIAAPVRSEYASSSNSLLQRGKDLSVFGQRLKTVAASHNLIILVINQVSDVFSPQPTHHRSPLSNLLPNSDIFPRSPSPQPTGSYTNEVSLSYASQAAHFAADTNNRTKQAALGLAWANLIDTRIMLSRNRTTGGKASVKRSMACVFSPFAPVGQVEFQITDKGIESVEQEERGQLGDEAKAEMDEDLEEASFWEGYDDVDMLAALEEKGDLENG